MKKHLITFIIFFLCAIFLFAKAAHAEEKRAGVSATFAVVVTTPRKDNRAEILEQYLKKMNSPLAPYAKDFVTSADENDLPWHLVAAISGTESTFGKFVPYNCNNAWGYGIYGDNRLCFPTYAAAIKTISKDLRQKYMNKWNAKTVPEIGRIYAASPHWASNTMHFMEKIEQFKENYEEENTALPISI